MQNIVNVRIDERLIHGQVAVLWSTHTKATIIMIVDNEVVKDAVNKAALKMVCPQQCKLSILTTQRAAAVSYTHLDVYKRQVIKIFTTIEGLFLFLRTTQHFKKTITFFIFFTIDKLHKAIK